MSPKQKFLAIFIALFVAIGLGILFEYLYKQSDRESLPINLFQSTFAKKEKQADKTMADLQKVVRNQQWDVFHSFEIANHSDISYYIFKGQDLLYWTDNKIDISTVVDKELLLTIVQNNNKRYFHGIVREFTFLGKDSKYFIEIIRKYRK